MINPEKFETILNNESFCILPFVHGYIRPDGGIQSCCLTRFENELGNLHQSSFEEIWNSESWKSLRLKLINNEKPDNCKGCYYSEDIAKNLNDQTNLHAYRKWINQKLSKHIDVLQFVNDDGSMTQTPIKHYETRFDNICNFKCVICNPFSSSSIAQEHERFKKNQGKKIVLNLYHDTDFLYEEFLKWFDGIEFFKFTGGEPLLSPTHWKILDKIINENRSDANIVYHTNMSVLKYKDKSIIDYWKKLSNTTVYVSLDSWGQRAEYVRYGTVWSEILENYKTLKKECPNIKLIPYSVVTSLTVLTITDFLDHLESEGIIDLATDYVQLNYLEQPEFFHFCSIGEDLVKQAIENITNWIEKKDKLHYSVLNSLNYIRYLLNQEIFTWHSEELRDFLKDIDFKRNLSCYNVFPELRSWFEKHNIGPL